MKAAATNPVYKIAFKHLFSKPRQTIVAILGVTFGITVFIFQAGLITGIQSFFIDRTINLSAHIHIYNDTKKKNQSILERYYTGEQGKANGNHWAMVSNQKPAQDNPKIRNAREIMEVLAKDENVLGVSPFLGSQVIFRAGLTQVGGRVSGIDVDKENFLFKVQDYMVIGDVNDLKTRPNGIILGGGLAESLNAKLNDYVSISSPKGVMLELKVVGINRTGITSVDDTRAYITLGNAQKLLNVEGAYITDINIKLKNIDRAEELATIFQRQFGYKAEDWKAANAGIFSIFKIQNLSTYLVITSILVVSGFGIFNILTMIIYEKMPDIAILKAIGFTDRAIRQIFLTEALFIGFFGGILGLILGFIVSKIISNIPLNINKGLITFEYLNINFDPLFYVTAFFFGLLATGLAGYFPARKASKVDPITIIRGK